MWFGDSVPDGDAHPWKDAALGSMYVYQTSSIAVCFLKQAANDADADWTPGDWVGSTALDGTAAPFSTAPIGSVYTYKDTGITIRYTKMTDNDDSADWYGEGCIYDLGVAYDDFTDGGAAVGTFVMTADIPAGAYVNHSVVRNVTGFANNTSATLTIGDGSDVDRYNTGTPSIFATAAVVAMGAPSGTRDNAAAVATPTLTVTTASDFTSVNAGALDVYIYFNVVA